MGGGGGVAFALNVPYLSAAEPARSKWALRKSFRGGGYLWLKKKISTKITIVHIETYPNGVYSLPEPL